MKDIDGPHEYQCRAYAKVNLALFVLGKRKDGYHDISSIMTAVQLFDRISIRESRSQLTVDCPSMPNLPQEQNLAYRAAFSFFAFLGKPSSSHIRIDKKIPQGSGMGGGSSDAAAVLLGLNRAFTDNSIKLGDLLSLASSIGSDVPFFLGFNGDEILWEAALCTGRGEKIKPIKAKPSFYLVIVVPSFQVRSVKAYGLWDDTKKHRYLVSEKASEKARILESLIDAITSDDPEEIALHLANDLEEPSSLMHPEISIIKEKLLSAGALGASMTGSGSAVLGVCRDLDHAKEVKERLLAILAADKIRDVIADIIVTKAGVSELDEPKSPL